MGLQDVLTIVRPTAATTCKLLTNVRAQMESVAILQDKYIRDLFRWSFENITTCHLRTRYAINQAPNTRVFFHFRSKLN